MWDLDSYPLAEEIGDPDLFVGREEEMTRLLDWAAGTKRRISKSMGILSRRKKGKTALLQRFFNILYLRNDPQLIPFYYWIPEILQTRSDFTGAFYRRILTQYFACTTRKPEWVGTLFTILQILDEFQYMNKYVVSDDDPERVELLCHSYMGPAESKFSPQIVAGSYIGWLEAILGHLTGRYDEWHLEGLTDDEALQAVYNYAYTYQVPITEATAPYIAEVTGNDPYYIAATISNRPGEKDLTTEEGVRDALSFETVAGQGRIARVWNEYLQDAFARVNDQDARKIVLYLARHEPEQRTRRQIHEDLSLTMTEGQLEKRLKQLVMADILAQGSSDFRYRGLGDRVFAMVFRRIYSEEIEELDDTTVENNFKRELAGLKGQLSVHKGSAAEYRVRYRLLVASLRGATLADVVQDSEDASASQAPLLGPFTVIRKARF